MSGWALSLSERLLEGSAGLGSRAEHQIAKGSGDRPDRRFGLVASGDSRRNRLPACTPKPTDDAAAPLPLLIALCNARRAAGAFQAAQELHGVADFARLQDSVHRRHD